MGAQIKNDMQNYFTYRQAKQSTKSLNPVSVKDTESVMGKQARNILLNTRIKPLKPLFDSEYVRP